MKFQLQVLVGGLNTPNGVALSEDGKHLYVAKHMDKSISVFEVQPNGALKNADNIDVGSHVDNIQIDNNGNFWLG